MLLLLSFLTCVLVCGISFILSYCKFDRWPPSLPGWLPIVGHVHLFFRFDPKDVWDFYKKISEYCVQNGGVITFSFGTRNIFIVSDPEDAYTIANSSVEKRYVYNMVKPWLGEGLLTSNGATWRAHRKIMNSAFTHEILNGLLPIFNKKANHLANRFESQKEKFDPEPLISLNNLEAICETSLGLNSEKHQHLFDEYRRSIKNIFDIMYERYLKLWLHNDIVFFFSILKRKQDKVLTGLHTLSNTILQKRKTEILELSLGHSSTDQFRPLLDTVLESSIEKGLLTEKELLEELDTIIFAGHDTMGITLTYTLMFLGTDQKRQEKAYQQIIEVMGDSKRDVEREDLPKLSYIECIAKESLRLYPVGPAFPRVVTKDVKLRNHVLKAGSACLIDAWAINRHPLWGPDAEEFNPERWLNPDTLPQFNKAFTGFGVGKRTCIGKPYAMMSLKVTLVHILRRYKLTADINKMTVKLDALLRPQSGHVITIERRH